MGSIGAIKDIFPFDNAKVKADLDALNLDLDEDERQYNNLVTAVGYLILVQLVKYFQGD